MSQFLVRSSIEINKKMKNYDIYSLSMILVLFKSYLLIHDNGAKMYFNMMFLICDKCFPVDFFNLIKNQ